MAFKVNEEIVEADAVVAVQAELKAQDRTFADLEEDEQLARAEEALIERVLVRQAAANDGPEIRTVDVKRELKRAMENAGGKDNFQAYLEHSGLTIEAIEAAADGTVVLHLIDGCGEHFPEGYWPAVHLGVDDSVVQVTVES